jgi:hypothetical protein
MPIPALLPGDPGPLPFLGHLRLRVEARGVWLAAAGRVGATGDATTAWMAARTVERALRGAAGGGDRHAWLWRCWEAVAAVPAGALGPRGGEDLSLVLVAGDPRGVGLAGVGLNAAWGLLDGALRPLVEGRHPLLSPPGRPSQMPGVLTLDAEPSLILANPSHRPPVTPAVGELARLCGVRA